MNAANPGLEPDLSGHVLDRYQLIRLLGIGGMGAVYEAEHMALEKRVAVKLLRQQFTMQPIARKRFLREAKAATRVKHPNVVDISDFGETAEGRVYFVMELLSGRDLRDVIEAEPQMPWSRVQKILIQTTSALEAAHASGIVHRDMKPSNCFLVEAPGLEDQDFIKVLDFGIAKFSGGNVGEETQGLTSTDEIFGTVGYMAPEMVVGITNDPRSDIYAIGVMMYRMLVGDLPFTGNTAFQILTAHVNESPPRPRSRVPSIPEGVEAIILKALAKKPDDRFASMRDFREALRYGALEKPAQAELRTPPPRVAAKLTPRIEAVEAEELLMRPRGAPVVDATQNLSQPVGDAKPLGAKPAIRKPAFQLPSPPSVARPPSPSPTPSKATARSGPEEPRTMVQGMARAAVEGATIVARPLGPRPTPAATVQAPPPVDHRPPTHVVPPTDDSGLLGAPLLEDDATFVAMPIDASAPWTGQQAMAAEPEPLQSVGGDPPLHSHVQSPSTSASNESSHALSSLPSVGGEPVSSSFTLPPDEQPTRRWATVLVALSVVGVSLVGAAVWLGPSSSDPPERKTTAANLEAKPATPAVEPLNEEQAEEPLETEVLIDEEPPPEPVPSEPEELASPKPAEPDPIESDEPDPPKAAPSERPPTPPKKQAKKPRSKVQTPRTEAKPLTDAQVVAGLRSKLIQKCKTDGTTTIQVEGAISTSGKILSPLVRPSGDRSECVRKVVKGAKFPATGSMRGMPIIIVKL